MTFHALLVSKDEQAAAVLNSVLPGLGITSVSCGYPEAICQLTEQKFDAVLVDFDDPHSAALVLQNAQQSAPDHHPIIVVLLSDRTKLRNVLGQGANFVIYKPVSLLQAEASLRPAAALIKRERRSSCRVPLQLPVQLTPQDAPDLEGILLDLSETGMEVLAAQPLCPAGQISARFTLPDGKTELQVRGEITRANPNGEAGVRFTSLTDNARVVLKAWIAANAPELPPADHDPVTQCKLTDLTLNACYVQTESVFPERTQVKLSLKAGDSEIQTDGIVRVMHPEFGMGIQFSQSSTGQVEGFFGLLANHPGTQPQLTILPVALSHSDESMFARTGSPEDALLELLHRHESLAQEDFLHELQAQRNPEVTPA